MNKLSKLPQFNIANKPANNKVIVYSLRCVSVNPYKSHPARYWKKNKEKFIDLFKQANANDADLILLNYSSTDDKFKSMKVVNATQKGIKTIDTKFSGLPAYGNFLKELGVRYTEIL